VHVLLCSVVLPMIVMRPLILWKLFDIMWLLKCLDIGAPANFAEDMLVVVERVVRRKAEIAGCVSGVVGLSLEGEHLLAAEVDGGILYQIL